MDIYHSLITKFGFDYMEELEIRFREDRNPNIFLPLHSVMFAETFHLTPMDDPYGYVRALNNTFDFSKIRYSDDYYEQFDVPNPWLSEEERAQKPFQETVFFSSASHVLTIHNKKD